MHNVCISGTYEKYMDVWKLQQTGTHKTKLTKPNNQPTNQPTHPLTDWLTNSPTN